MKPTWTNLHTLIICLKYIESVYHSQTGVLLLYQISNYIFKNHADLNPHFTSNSYLNFDWLQYLILL